MLSKAGQDAARPEWVEAHYGIRDERYYLTEQQAQAILDLRLHKLTGLGMRKFTRYQELLDAIAELLHILNSPVRLLGIRDELTEVAEYGDERKTEITNVSHDICWRI